MLRVAINGYGRIGRIMLRILFEQNLQNKIQLVAINDLGDANTLAHLTRFDSTFGRFNKEVKLENNYLEVDGHKIELMSEPEVANLPWHNLNIDVVLECTGKAKSRAAAEQHITAGAKGVLLSHPLADADLTVVYGVNHQLLADQVIVSNASCTTNCLAPLAKVLNDAVGIERGMMTTIHSYTNDQNLVDKTHKDLYRARAAAHSIIPTSTGAAKAIGLVIPELDGRLDGMAVRVPTLNVSLVDLTFTAKKTTTADAINKALMAGAKQFPPGVMECNEQPLVSCDFNGYSVSCVADLKQTKVQGNLVKVMAWYDNEWAFAHRMLDTLAAWKLK